MTRKKALALQSWLLASLFILSAPQALGKDEQPPKKVSPVESKKPQVSSKKKTETKQRSPGREATRKAKSAQTRASGPSAPSNHLLLERLEVLEKLWLRVAEAQEKAAALEMEAATIEKNTLKLRQQAKRAESLVEQTEARRARALGRLKTLGLSDASPQSTPNKPKSSSAAK